LADCTNIFMISKKPEARFILKIIGGL